MLVRISRASRSASILALGVTCAVVVIAGCRSAERPPAVAAALQVVLSGSPVIPVAPAVWAEVATFYAGRSGVPAWIDDQKERSTERATRALELLHTAPAHGLEAEAYGQARIVEMATQVHKLQKDSPERFQQLAELDVRITTALLAFGRDVAIGQVNPASVDPQWKTRRQPPDIVGTLGNAAGGDLAEWLDSIRPPHPEYIALQKALADMEGQVAKGGRPQVADPGFHRGMSDPAVKTLRVRLAASGHLQGDAATDASPVYDRDVETAVRSFQDLHSIKATGIADPATLKVMNLAIDERVEQLKMNLERWRWMPDDLGTNHFIVNIPYFHLIAVEGGHNVMDIRVVVGKLGHETPMFSDEMESVVFSPYWNIPDSIAEGEMVPAVGRDTNYLAKNNIEVLRVSNDRVETIDPSTVNWDDPKAMSGLALRQRPGSKNSLGQVKFLFPNTFNVYLHDTPADALFSRQSRAFSHGCMRVEEPEKLAKYVLRDEPEWTTDRIGVAMHAGVEKHVKLKETIPVHIVYFTAWVDAAGGLHFQPDIYGYDKKQAALRPGALQ